jgi:hypothetical protein
MIKFSPTSEDLIRTSIVAARAAVAGIRGRLDALDSAEFVPGSSGRRLDVRIASLRSRMLLKYFAVDQEFNLVRSYSFEPGGLMRRPGKQGG